MSDEALDVPVKNRYHTRFRAKGLYRPPRVACPQESLGFKCKTQMNQQCPYNHTSQKLTKALDENLLRLFSSKYFDPNRLLDQLPLQALSSLCVSVASYSRVCLFFWLLIVR
jgi:hypothetical protein